MEKKTMEKTAGGKRFMTALTCLFLAVFLFGCGADNGPEGSGEGAEPEAGQPPAQWELLTASVREKLADDRYFYREADRAEMRYDDPENMKLGGRWSAFLGEGGAVRYALYQLDTPQFGTDDYTMIQTVGGDGGLREIKWEASYLNGLFDADYACSVRLYPVAGSKALVVVRHRREGSHVRIVDEENRLLAGFTLPRTIAEEFTTPEHGSGFLVPETDMIADGEYNLYTVWRPSDSREARFMAVDREGGLLWEDSLSGDVRIDSMVVFPDRTVGCMLYESGEDKKPGTYRLIRLGSDGLQPAAEIGAEGLTGRKCVTCFDDKTILYANREGLYRCSYDASDTQELYLWAENGVNIEEASIHKMQVRPNGDIEILLRSEQVYTYLRLELSDEKKLTTELVFAVTENNRRSFQGVVADFNQEHSDCQILMTVYEEDSRLLTELTAARGPVLIDTSLLSFADNGELWESMDDTLAQWGLGDVLLEKTLLCGQIDGKQYGLPFRWQLISFATLSYREESWNYEDFLKYLRENDSLEMLYEEQSPEGFMTWFLSRGLEESFFIDADAGRAYFDTERFADAAALAGRLAAERSRADDGEQVKRIREGSCLGEFVYLYDPVSVAYYDARLGENANYIGFPGREGSVHYIAAEAPLAVRKTASDREKEAAFLFLRSLLEKDAQAFLAGEFGFSVRRDVFEELLESAEEEVSYMIGGEEVRLPVDKEHIKERFSSLYEKAAPYPFMPDSVGGALAEELREYFYGGKSRQEVRRVLQNRVQLYLDERK